MIMTSFWIVFENINLHLHQKKFQNIGTPPLPSYRATPILIVSTIVALGGWLFYLKTKLY